MIKTDISDLILLLPSHNPPAQNLSLHDTLEKVPKASLAITPDLQVRDPRVFNQVGPPLQTLRPLITENLAPGVQGPMWDMGTEPYPIGPS